MNPAFDQFGTRPPFDRRRAFERELGLRPSSITTSHLESYWGPALWKVLDTAIGERRLATEIHQLQLEALPEEPRRFGYLPMPLLLEYFA